MDDLKHYGVLGMKWGVRKKRSTISRLEKNNEHLNRRLQKKEWEIDQNKKNQSSLVNETLSKIDPDSLSSADKKLAKAAGNRIKKMNKEQLALYKKGYKYRDAIDKNVALMQYLEQIPGEISNRDIVMGQAIVREAFSLPKSLRNTEFRVKVDNMK